MTRRISPQRFVGLPSAMLILAIAAGTLAGCGRDDSPQPQPGQQADDQPAATGTGAGDPVVAAPRPSGLSRVIFLATDTPGVQVHYAMQPLGATPLQVNSGLIMDDLRDLRAASEPLACRQAPGAEGTALVNLLVGPPTAAQALPVGLSAAAGGAPLTGLRCGVQRLSAPDGTWIVVVVDAGGQDVPLDVLPLLRRHADALGLEMQGVTAQ